jgi:enterochelin esterase-like enzyme
MVLIPGLTACGPGGNVTATVNKVKMPDLGTETAIPTPPVQATAKPVISPTSSPGLPAILAETPTKTATQLSTRTATKTMTGESALTATPTLPACMKLPGQLLIKSLTTSLLHNPLKYRVYLPPCYAAQTDRRYPVLYLFHGQGYTDDQWERIGVDEQSDKLIAAGTIPPLIIVMPYDESSAQPSETNFSKVIVEQLIPAIDQTYRTKPERQYRAVGGMSRGGGWAIHFGITYWQLFGALGAHSPAVFHSDGLRIKSLLDALPHGGSPRIYIDIGERDRPEILEVATWFEGLLDQKDIPHEWHLFSGYHAEAYWSAHLDQYLIWYTQGW